MSIIGASDRLGRTVGANVKSPKWANVAATRGEIGPSAFRLHAHPAAGNSPLLPFATSVLSGCWEVIRAYGVLAGILDDAVKSRRLAANPSRGVENLPHKTGKRRVYLTVEDVARLGRSFSRSPTPVSVGAKPWRCGCAMRSFSAGGYRYTTTPFRSGLVTSLAEPRAERSDLCRFLSSC